MKIRPYAPGPGILQGRPTWRDIDNLRVLMSIWIPRLSLFMAALAWPVSSANGQATGCTDPLALNYDSTAVMNDGSCQYPNTSLTLTQQTSLATPLLDENSGIAFLAGGLWTHNDSGNDNRIYRVDTASNSVLQTVEIANGVNTDWEDIAMGGSWLFIGDIGNNSGNRQDLRIYRIHQSALSDTATVAFADVINYSYSDQVTFPSLPNNNNFDCEAMVFSGDSLHLFSKNWVDKQTKHYVLPNQAGTHVAELRETLNAGFLVTGGAVQDGGVIALAGYDNTGLAPVYLYMLYDYAVPFLFNGNKRRFNAGNALLYGQVEGVDFLDGARGLVSNERFTQIVNVAPALRAFSLAPYLPSSFVFPVPAAAFTVSDTVICRKVSVTYTDLSLPAASAWQWIFPGGQPPTSTQQHPVVTYNTTGIYGAILIAGNASGYDTLAIDSLVQVKAQPNAVATALGPAQFCTGDSVVLQAFSKPGFTYQWKRYSKVLAGATSSAYTARSTGNYKVVVTNANGCTKQSAPVVVTGPPRIKLTVIGSLDLCPGDSVRLSVPFEQGNAYQWKKDNVNISGATDNYYYVTVPGRYWARATNAYGCKRLSSKKTVTNICRIAGPRQSPVRDLRISPNPANDYLSVEAHVSDVSDISVLLFDSAGRTVYSSRSRRCEAGRHEWQIDISALPAGTYLCEVRAGMIVHRDSLMIVK